MEGIYSLNRGKNPFHIDFTFLKFFFSHVVKNFKPAKTNSYFRCEDKISCHIFCGLIIIFHLPLEKLYCCRNSREISCRESIFILKLKCANIITPTIYKRGAFTLEDHTVIMTGLYIAADLCLCTYAHIDTLHLKWFLKMSHFLDMKYSQ
jgi:hypothetical protein